MNMYYTKSNNGHDYANTRVRIFVDDGTVQLISYTTVVIEITPDGWMTCFGLYSRTTIRHIGWFMRERGLTYQLAKQLYQNNKKYNVLTGEYADLV